MKIIEIHALNRYFNEGENRVHILKNVSLSIEQGDFVAIIGQSGSGKSTLMNIIGCLDTATSGSYKIEGQETTSLNADQLSDLRSQKFGFIFQRYNLLSSLSALENVALPAIYAGISHHKRLARAQQLLEKLGLGDKAQNKPSQLSGGQQQRVSIARALMNGGDIILADEPTGALDSQSGQNVMAILRQLHAEGHTIVMVTHDREIAAQANRVIEIKDGEIISDTQKNTPKSAVKNHRTFKQFGFSKDQLSEALKMSVSAIIAHKMRSLLTMLGIIIGITSVVSVVALGNGSQQKILENIKGMGTNTITIFNGTGFGDRRAEQMKNLTVNDANTIEKQSYVQNVTPNSSSSGILVIGNQSFSNTSLQGIGEQYFDVEGMKLVQGRLLDTEDIAQSNTLALIDESGRKSMFPHENPIGKTVIFNKRAFRIIGVVTEKKWECRAARSNFMRLILP